jgi:hypothetical protein
MPRKPGGGAPTHRRSRRLPVIGQKPHCRAAGRVDDDTEAALRGTQPGFGDASGCCGGYDLRRGGVAAAGIEIPGEPPLARFGIRFQPRRRRRRPQQLTSDDTSWPQMGWRRGDPRRAGVAGRATRAHVPGQFDRLGRRLRVEIEQLGPAAAGGAIEVRGRAGRGHQVSPRAGDHDAGFPSRPRFGVVVAEAALQRVFGRALRAMIFSLLGVAIATTPGL